MGPRSRTVRISEDVFKRLDIKLVSDDEIQMGKINAGVEGQTIAFTALVIGRDEQKTFVKEADVMCPTCYTEARIRCGFDRKLRELHCVKASCRGQKMEIQKTLLI